MPIYMDRHDVSEQVTAAIVADLHQKDLQIQHLFNCKGLTYWFDDKRKTAFCLVEAPDKEAIQKMHDHAHGVVAHKIIEVDAAVVESFLGRIEDPVKSRNISLNIINDPAFRIIMIASTEQYFFKKFSGKKKDFIPEGLNKAIIDAIRKFKGRLVKQKAGYFLISFDSVTHAVLCALEMQKISKEKFKPNSGVNLKIGLSAGIPVSEKEGIFEDTIQMAERLCYFVKGDIVMTSQVSDLYESENLNIPPDKKYIMILHQEEETFLKLFMDFTEKEWSNPALTADEFSRNMGYSKSQLYRKIISLAGISPNKFINAYRLKKALELLNKSDENISQIAYETGFTTPAYFSKCFKKAFGILPSVYKTNYVLPDN